MRRPALLVVLLVLAGCGSSKQTAPSTVAPVTTTAPARPALTVAFTAPTHHPRVNAPWRYTVRVTYHGRPVRAHIVLNVLFNSIVVGKIGRHDAPRGRWAETIKWPPASRGNRLVFETLATSAGRSGSAHYPLEVK